MLRDFPLLTTDVDQLSRPIIVIYILCAQVAVSCICHNYILLYNIIIYYYILLYYVLYPTLELYNNYII